MKISKLIEMLGNAQQQHGDLSVHFLGGGAEITSNEVIFVQSGAPPIPGPVTGPHLFEPDRLVIKGISL